MNFAIYPQYEFCHIYGTTYRGPYVVNVLVLHYQLRVRETSRALDKKFSHRNPQ
jgi:hypothetical protein